MSTREKKFLISGALAVLATFGTLICINQNAIYMIFCALLALAAAIIVPKGESIKAAAISHNGVVYYVPRPGRHHNVCWLMSEQGLGPDTMRYQGFVTSLGRFVNRREACVIAKEAGQIKQKTSPEYELFSEDMW